MRTPTYKSAQYHINMARPWKKDTRKAVCACTPPEGKKCWDEVFRDWNNLFERLERWHKEFQDFDCDLSERIKQLNDCDSRIDIDNNKIKSMKNNREYRCLHCRLRAILKGFGFPRKNQRENEHLSQEIQDFADSVAEMNEGTGKLLSFLNHVLEFTDIFKYWAWFGFRKRFIESLFVPRQHYIPRMVRDCYPERKSKWLPAKGKWSKGDRDTGRCVRDFCHEFFSNESFREWLQETALKDKEGIVEQFENLMEILFDIELLSAGYFETAEKTKDMLKSVQEDCAGYIKRAQEQLENNEPINQADTLAYGRLNRFLKELIRDTEEEIKNEQAFFYDRLVSQNAWNTRYMSFQGSLESGKYTSGADASRETHAE